MMRELEVELEQKGGRKYSAVDLTRKKKILLPVLEGSSLPYAWVAGVSGPESHHWLTEKKKM